MPHTPIARHISLLALTMLLAAVFQTSASQAQDAGAGPDTLVEKYEDWIVECGATQDESGHVCRMAQRVSSSETKKLILAVFIRGGKDVSTAAMTLVGPLGISLPEGVTLSVGDSQLAKLDFMTCRPAGCIAQQKMTDEIIKAFRAGSKATVGVTALNGKKLSVPISLKGFSAAWKRLSAL